MSDILLLRKKEVKCEKCKATLHDIPMYLRDFHIHTTTNFLTPEQYEELKGSLVWYCPMCNFTNVEIMHKLLGENDYIAIMAARSVDYTVEEVAYA